jgi:hypothetical protein
MGGNTRWDGADEVEKSETKGCEEAGHSGELNWKSGNLEDEQPIIRATFFLVPAVVAGEIVA